jgi:hypothetical protein
MTHTGELPRRDQLADLEYDVHGRIGCGITFRSGECVDVDLLPDGTPSFDTWRVVQYALSIGLPRPEVAIIEAEAEQLLKRGWLYPLRTEWYSVAMPPGSGLPRGSSG